MRDHAHTLSDFRVPTLSIEFELVAVSRRPRSVPCWAANLRNRVLRSRSAAWPTLRAPGLPTHRRGDRHLVSKSDRPHPSRPGVQIGSLSATLLLGNPIGSTAATTGSIIGGVEG